MAEKNLLPHQQRVLDEYTELSDKVRKLGEFIAGQTGIYRTLSVDEQVRLKAQHGFMSLYLAVLTERINNF